MALETWSVGPEGGRPHVLITGGVHGDEFEPMTAIRRLGALLAGREMKGRATLVPVVNDAAFRLGRRTAEDGLDLARTCPGRADGSVTERAAHELSALIRDADAYIDLHTGGLALQVFPLAGYMLHRDVSVLDRQRRMARLFGLPIVWGTDPSLDGRSLSTARDANVPAIYAEYLGGGGLNPLGVAAYVRGCLNILVDLGVVAGEIELLPSEPLIVEDARPGAGHMQVRHPSPCEGLFEPSVSLGDRVGAGEPIGAVADNLGRNVAPVVADASGIVLVLRTFARVSRGDSLGVVLETERPLPGLP
jgi:predicted deacylase